MQQLKKTRNHSCFQFNIRMNTSDGFNSSGSFTRYGLSIQGMSNPNNDSFSLCFALGSQIYIVDLKKQVVFLHFWICTLLSEPTGRCKIAVLTHGLQQVVTPHSVRSGLRTLHIMHSDDLQTHYQTLCLASFFIWVPGFNQNIHQLRTGLILAFVLAAHTGRSCFWLQHCVSCWPHAGSCAPLALTTSSKYNFLSPLKHSLIHC